ncbi:hypothetical protein TSUD_38650 [Trifolium subterraneum]|uniref:3'-5' exonuclease domain-containing protein n=1 Tax=Trifolium subterraneum TaxID=3900 RepID=A0A2Z6MV25_TRISU|nr:hypothetical protein TSUD_38650 [Trifolium subterraneum]
MFSSRQSYEVKLDGLSISTIFTNQLDIVDEYISRFMRSSSYTNKITVFGFDTEWLVHNPDTTSSKCAAIHLCYERECLIIKLSSFYGVPDSLVKFLRHPNYTFVGFGIKDNVAKLEKNYGFGCRNAVELGPLAATVLKRPRLSYCGVDKLLFVVNQVDLRRDMFHWSSFDNSQEHARNAAINVYSYHLIGTKLLAQDWEE